jgi:hypothetical protein
MNDPVTLDQLTEKYQANKDKPHFPLNSLRLVYLLLAETIGNPTEELKQWRSQQIMNLIPRVQALMDARAAFKSQNPGATLDEEIADLVGPMGEIQSMLDTPLVHTVIDHALSYVFPLQDTLLISLYQDLSTNKTFALQDIYTIFHVRSMDSMLYAGFVTAILQHNVDPSALPPHLHMALNYKLNALYQLNDLVDTIVYAKEDMESQNFSPFQIIRKTVGNIEDAKNMIKNIAMTFERRIQTFPLGDQTEELLAEFGHKLVGVIGQG